MKWHAAWIWHPPKKDMDNLYVYARKAFTLHSAPGDAHVFVTAGSLYKLYVNGQYIGRGPNPTDPSRYYYDVHKVSEFLHEGRNAVAAICYNYGVESRGVLKQNCGPGGFLLELRAPGRDGEPLLITDGQWRVLQALPWDQDAPVNCTLLGDFKEVYDSRKEVEAWMAPDFDDGHWLEPEVLGVPPVEPWTELVEREIPFLDGERVRPVNAAWESASVTYSWRDDWEVYDEQDLVPDNAHKSNTEPMRVMKTHEDFTPSVVLDFGRDVTGYPEITVEDSAGGVLDVLYGEDSYLVRVDRFILKGGPQSLQPYNRRTFRFMKLAFPETPAPVHISDVSMKMDTYPVERAGSFTCSDDLLNRIWEVGAYTMRMSMLDHFVDCPWRERTLYGGDMFAENLIAHYAFGDPRMNRKCLRQMAHIQYDEGAIPCHGPYRGARGFIPSWSAYWGLALLDHYALTGERDVLEELWPALRRLLEWTLARLDEHHLGLIGTPQGRGDFQHWMQADKPHCEPWQNFPFYVLLERCGQTADATDRADEAERYGRAAAQMGRALREHLVDGETGMVRPIGIRQKRFQSGQYDNALMLWSGLPEAQQGRDMARRMFLPGTGRIGAPFHGLFVLEGLFAYGEDLRAVDFSRRYWGEMLNRGATTFWDNFSLDWPPGLLPNRQTSLCHGWAAAPTCVLPARVLGVRPLEPGFARVLVEPHPADLGWAAGTVPTPHGPVRVNWERTTGRFRMELTVPAGCAAVVSMPPVAAHAPRVRLDGSAAQGEPSGRRMIVRVGDGEHALMLG